MGNGDACGRRLCRQGGRSIYCNHLHLLPNQIRCELWQSIELILSPAVHDRNVFSFDKTSILQAPMECAQAIRECLGRRAVEEAHDRHRRLLRARCKRPCNHAAENSREMSSCDCRRFEPWPHRSSIDPTISRLPRNLYKTDHMPVRVAEHSAGHHPTTAVIGAVSAFFWRRADGEGHM